jgi:hypothetical protein
LWFDVLGELFEWDDRDVVGVGCVGFGVCGLVGCGLFGYQLLRGDDRRSRLGDGDLQRGRVWLHPVGVKGREWVGGGVEFAVGD